LSVVDEVLSSLTRTLPVFYYMSTGVDYSTESATDPVVVKLKTPGVCLNQSSSVCGATTSRDGYDLSALSMNQSECAGCYYVSGEDCGEGFLKSKGWFTDACCKKHSCGQETYRASQLPELLRKLGRDAGAEMTEYTQSVHTTGDPGVDTFCIYSYNVQTYQELSFDSYETMDTASVTLADGDGTVDAASLKICENWESTLKVFKIPGVVHGGLFNIEQVANIIVTVAIDDTKSFDDWVPLSNQDVTVFAGLQRNLSVAPTSKWVDQGSVVVV